jgi:hypothetical protein
MILDAMIPITANAVRRPSMLSNTLGSYTALQMIVDARPTNVMMTRSDTNVIRDDEVCGPLVVALAAGCR